MKREVCVCLKITKIWLFYKLTSGWSKSHSLQGLDYYPVPTKMPICRRCRHTSLPMVFHFSSHFCSLFRDKTLEMGATRRNLEMMH